MLTKDIYLKAVNSTHDGITIAEAKGKDNPIVYVNPAFEKLSGYSKSEIIGKDCRFLQGMDRDQPEIVLIRSAIQYGEASLVTLRNYKKDGGVFWNELSISPIINEYGKITHYIGVQKDVTERVELERKLKAANRSLSELNARLEAENKIDALTGIFNRKVINDEVCILWNGAKRTQEHISLLFIDIDNFKIINDTYGHGAGDTCLKYLTNVLTNSFERHSDVVLRYGGEEFMVVSFGLGSEAVLGLANKLVADVASKPVKVKEPDIRIIITVSIGVIATKPSHKATLEEFISGADAAMYEAKVRGRNQAVLAKA